MKEEEKRVGKGRVREGMGKSKTPQGFTEMTPLLVTHSLQQKNNEKQITEWRKKTSRTFACVIQPSGQNE